MTNQTAAPLHHTSLGATHRPVDFFVHSILKRRMTLDAPYQRGDVWTGQQRIDLIRSWLMGVPVPAVTINDRMTSTWSKANPKDRGARGYSYAVIDGRQRLTTAVMWYGGELAIPGSWLAPKFIVATNDTDDGPYVTVDNLSLAGQLYVDSLCSLATNEAQVGTVEEEAMIYLLLNGGGTPQTAADMTNAARVAQGG